MRKPMKIGPYYLVRDTGRPPDYPPRARAELVDNRLRIESLIGKLWRPAAELHWPFVRESALLPSGTEH